MQSNTSVLRSYTNGRLMIRLQDSRSVIKKFVVVSLDMINLCIYGHKTNRCPQTLVLWQLLHGYGRKWTVKGNSSKKQ